MLVIQNKWVEKQRKKKEKETAPSFEMYKSDSWKPVDVTKSIDRFNKATQATRHKTLTGLRK